MRVAFLKPDHGGVGGFERLVERCRARLGERGVAVEQVAFDARTRARRLHGIPLDDGTRDWHDEYFLYLTALERLDRLDLSGFDVVVASQPPSYLARHPSVVALTYHQARVFYDLADEFVAAGFARPRVHEAAVAQVRAVDGDRVGDVRTWLTGSEEVAARLARYWGIDGTTPFRASPEVLPVPEVGELDPAGPALCVSRHEWPKRTELVAQAAVLDPGGRYELLGGGSRLPWVRHLVERWAADPDAAPAHDPEGTWRNRGAWQLPEGERPAGTGPSEHLGGRLRIHGEVDDAARDDAYRRAAVVVAPALREDYGLTVLEAFAHARPVIVCDDGGGLVELVADTGAAVVVEPTAQAIAAAVAELRDDPARLQAMAIDALEAARRQAATDDLAPLVDAIREAAGGADG
ncbi:MAG TPA: glycosyltransferase family 4 protein [Acidimicrobiales bacterium]|nr:glycosyltransferase family 4 protein [Acidimicrobiales bacterium]